jgi:hypothetical protein|tara:strand:+ start:355 stop:618 length:264 start_codon:yes stop_codon:yes gene_type:complete
VKKYLIKYSITFTSYDRDVGCQYSEDRQAEYEMEADSAEDVADKFENYYAETMSGYEGKRKYVELPKWDWMDTSMKIDEIIEFDDNQ